MAQICLVYARPNRRVVQQLYDTLIGHYSVWWDDHIHSGNYRAEIERQLGQAKCVIPVWCRVSRADADVLDEAEFAQQRRIPLLPILVEEVEPPLGYRSLHTVNLIGWKGEPGHAGIQELLRNVKSLLTSPPRLLPREESIVVDGRPLPLPTFLHSVSSHETQLTPEAGVKALALLRTDAVLVSAYDMIHEKRATHIASGLKKCRKAGGVVVLDSGNYEAYRKKDNRWTPHRLREAIALTPHDFAFCFDDLHPPSNVDSLVRNVVKACERDGKHSSKPVLPIVHAMRGRNGVLRTDNLPEIVRRVAREVRPAMIAVPERELGDGLLSRARTVFEIRRRLDELGYYQPLHLLGTGNPLSIAVLAASGADCFDGLEWCRTVVDHESARLFHFRQYEFFSWQSAEAAMPLVREAATSDRIEFAGKVAFHNLEFFRAWMAGVRDMVRTRKLDRFLTDKLPGGADGLSLLESALPEVFG